MRWRYSVKLGDLVKLGEEFGVVMHINDVNPELAHLEDYSLTVDVLCDDGVWTIEIDDLEVIDESR
jgi:hypothetical protein